MADTALRRGPVLADASGSGRHLFGVLPSGRALPTRVWNARHRGILAFLWAHVPFLFVFGLLTHHSVEHSFADVQPIIVAAALATYPHFSRGWRSGFATFGLVACSA